MLLYIVIFLDNYINDEGIIMLSESLKYNNSLTNLNLSS